MRTYPATTAAIVVLTAASCSTAAASHQLSASPFPRPQAAAVRAITDAWRATFGTSRGLQVSIDQVVLSDADHAIVSYRLYHDDRPVFGRQSGLAVRHRGRWQVSLGAKCAVDSLTLKRPPACPHTRATSPASP
jgi:hypothetical protein